MSIYSPDDVPAVSDYLATALHINESARNDVISTVLPSNQTREIFLKSHCNNAREIPKITDWSTILYTSKCRIAASLNSQVSNLDYLEAQLQASLFEIFAVPRNASAIGTRILDESVGHYGARTMLIGHPVQQFENIKYNETRMGSLVLAMSASLLTRRQIEACIDAGAYRDTRSMTFAERMQKLLG